MITDIDNKEISVGDVCICTLNTRSCYKIRITKITAAGIHYECLPRNGNIWKSYMHMTSDGALHTYKVNE